MQGTTTEILASELNTFFLSLSFSLSFSLSQPPCAIKSKENPLISHTTVTPRSFAFSLFQFILRIFFFDCHVTSLSLARFPRDPSTVSYYRKRSSISHYCREILFVLRKLQSIASPASTINLERKTQATLCILKS